jgi:hypothetical protein
MTTRSKPPLKPEDFPLEVEGEKINKQGGTPIADDGVSCRRRRDRRPAEWKRSQARGRQVVSVTAHRLRGSMFLSTLLYRTGAGAFCLSEQFGTCRSELHIGARLVPPQPVLRDGINEPGAVLRWRAAFLE